MSAVKSSGFALKYASDSMRKDKEIIMEAVKNLPQALRYIHQSLKNDPDILNIKKLRSLKWHGTDCTQSFGFSFLGFLEIILSQDFFQ